MYSRVLPIAAYVFAIALYLSVTVPALRTIVEPLEGVDTREDRIDAMRVLAAGNTIIVVLLGAILALQVSKRTSYLLASLPLHLPLRLFFLPLISGFVFGVEYPITELTRTTYTTLVTALFAPTYLDFTL